MKKILIVEDEKTQLFLLEQTLSKENYIVYSACTGEDAVELLEKVTLDLVLLDLTLPDMNGMDVLRKIRMDERMKWLPVMIITGKTNVIDTVVGFEMGADDYIYKPVNIRILLSRISAVFRRLQTPGIVQGQVLKIQDIVLDTIERRLFKNDNFIPLTLKEYEIAKLLMVTPNKVFSRDEILEHVWFEEELFDTRTVDVHIQRLRKKIEDDSKFPKYIETVRGIGYKFNRT